MKLLTILLASIVLTSCSTKFNSKEEANTAHLEFLRGNKNVAIVYVPTDEEVEKQNRNAEEDRKERCGAQDAETNEFVPTPYGNFPVLKEYFFDCGEGQKKVFTKEQLTNRYLMETRICNHAQETQQYVCKEWKVDGIELSKKEWNEIKPTYTYFKY